jgi:hypothetical protein
MPTLISTLVFLQVIGAGVGVVNSVWSELAYIRALKDGKIDIAERLHLDHIARGLRFGLTVLLLASLGLVIVAYIIHATVQPALTPSYWVLITIALTIIAVALALSRRRISFTLGSAMVFSGWWFLIFLTLGQIPALTFGAAVALYVVATGILYGVLHYTRMFATSK